MRKAFVFFEVLLGLVILSAAVFVMFMVYRSFSLEKEKTTTFNYLEPLQIIGSLELKGQDRFIKVKEGVVCEVKSTVKDEGILSFSAESARKIYLVEYKVICNDGLEFNYFKIETLAR